MNTNGDSLNDKSRSLEELEEIDQVCEAFEADWRRYLDGRMEQPPLVIEFLEKVQEQLRPDLLKQVTELDIHYREEANDPAGKEDYRSIFEDYRVPLAPFFEELYPTHRAEREPHGEGNGRPPGEAPEPGRKFGEYDLMDIIGTGGMGQVFKARQRSLDRIVAIKILGGGAYAPRQAIERFQLEANAVAALSHPNIVTIHEVGTHHGCSFISMERIEGPTLQERTQKRAMEPKQAASLAKTLAEAIAYAHQHDIVHRDLKPGNILLRAKVHSSRRLAKRNSSKDEKIVDDPCIVDFGLAKRIDREGFETRPGVLLGTPNYIAPEQALKALPKEKPAWGIASPTPLSPQNQKELDKAIDIYGIGAILYTTLTQNPPFVGETETQTLLRAIHDEPVRPRTIVPKVPIDLETICLKCLKKRPDQRYESAQALADDLDRFLNHEPILARRESRLERLSRWTKKNKLFAGLFVLAIFGSLFATSGWLLATINLRSAKTSEARSLISTNKVGRRFAALEAISVAASIWPSAELRELAISAMSNVDLRLDRHFEANPKFACAVDNDFIHYACCDEAGRIQIRLVADNKLVQTLSQLEDRRPIIRMEFSANGCFLAVHYQKPNNSEGKELFQIWNWQPNKVLESPPNLLHGDAWALDRKTETVVVAARNGDIVFCNLENDEVVKTLPRSKWAGVISPSPQGDCIAVSRIEGHRIEILDSSSGKIIQTLPHDTKILDISWRSNGNELISSAGRDVYLWDVETATPIWIASEHEANVASVALSPDESLLASADWDGMVEIRRISDGAILLETSGNLWLNFSNDGRYLAGAADKGRVGIWELSLASEARVLRPRLGSDGIQYIEFSQCGRLLATTDYTGIQLWDATTSEEPMLRLSHESMTNAIFVQEGLLAAGRSEIHYWPIQIKDSAVNIGKHQVLPVPIEIDGRIDLIASDQTGDRLAILKSKDGQVAIVDRTSGEKQRVDVSEQNDLGSIALSPDGKLLVTGTMNQRRTTRIWEVADRKQKTGDAQKESVSCRTIDSGDAHVGFTPDGSLLVIGSDSHYQFFDTSSFAISFELERIANLRGPMAFCPTNTVIAIVESHDFVTLYDWQSRRRLARLENPTSGVVCNMCFSEDGKKFAVATENRKVHLWNLTELEAGLKKVRLGWQYETAPNPPSAESSQPLLIAVPSELESNASRQIELGFRDWRERSDDWYQERIKESSLLGKWDLLLSDVDLLLAVNPDNIDLHVERAKALASLGQWEEAIAAYQRVLSLGPPDAMYYYFIAAAQLKLGQSEAYQQTCETAFQTHSESESPKVLALLAWTCLLSDTSNTHRQVQLRSRLKATCEKYPMSRFANSALALTILRGGEAEAAMRQVNVAISTHITKDGNPSDWLLNGLALVQQGNIELAKKELLRSRQFVEKASLNGASRLSWIDRLEYELLGNELAKKIANSR